MAEHPCFVGAISINPEGLYQVIMLFEDGTSMVGTNDGNDSFIARQDGTFESYGLKRVELPGYESCWIHPGLENVGIDPKDEPTVKDLCTRLNELLATRH